LIMGEAKALSNEQAKAMALIDELVRECAKGGEDKEWLAVMLAGGAGLNVDEIQGRFEAARELWREAQKPKAIEPTDITPPPAKLGDGPDVQVGRECRRDLRLTGKDRSRLRAKLARSRRS
jgi:hypothetical protein